MLSKNQEKHIRQLQQLKYRRRTGLFVLEGEKMAMEALTGHGDHVEAVLALPTWVVQAGPRLEAFRKLVTTISEPQMKRLSALKTPSPVLVVMRMPAVSTTWAFGAQGFALYLDGIRDPGNMGTIIRIADWFGLDFVAASPDSVDFFNPKVVQASMASILRVPLAVVDRPRLSELPAGTELWVADMAGSDVQLTGSRPARLLLAIGNESRGLSVEAARTASRKIAIARHPAGRAESLNAAVATGILCAQLINQ